MKHYHYPEKCTLEEPHCHVANNVVYDSKTNSEDIILICVRFIEDCQEHWERCEDRCHDECKCQNP